MTHLSTILAMVKGNLITGEQTQLIDEALANACVEQIPMAEGLRVVEYIDLQLAHNDVSDEIRRGLDRLHRELSLRGA